jgi:hypothetical protein
MKENLDPVEKLQKNSFFFWLVASSIIGSISLIFYFPFVFLLLLISTPIDIKPQTVELLSWVFSLAFAFGVVWGGWKIFKSEK